jgi:hypothetical protein
MVKIAKKIKFLWASGARNGRFEHLFEKNGLRPLRVKVQGMEDKQQIIVVVSSSTAGILLHFQVIFRGTTSRTLPPSKLGWQDCEDARWHLTSENSLCVSLVYHVQARDILTPYALFNKHSFFFKFLMFILL